MLAYEDARKLYEESKEETKKQPNDFKKFYQDFLTAASEYRYSKNGRRIIRDRAGGETNPC